MRRAARDGALPPSLTNFDSHKALLSPKKSDTPSSAPNPGLYYCLTCAGTGHHGGRLSGKKCKTCKGTKRRYIDESNVRGWTILDGRWAGGNLEDD